MKKLWEKHDKQHTLAEAYCFGDAGVVDNKLVVFDVLGSIVHAKMLGTIGLLTPQEVVSLEDTLKEILVLYEKGEFFVKFGDEDVHTKIENFLVSRLGDTGKKIHTGRSRNDQVLLDLRLFTKDALGTIASACMRVAHAFVLFAMQHEFVPMPGYTHMQKAMPSSVGMWAGSFAESLLDDTEALKLAYAINDQNPLGSGAAYGVPLPLDRAYTSSHLGFAKTQQNALYCQASRAKSHLTVMNAASQIMITLGRFAQDMMLFTTSEFNFFTIDPALCTGSSIMPQKTNVDIMELLRARTYRVLSLEQMVGATVAGLPSGYNADFGETKAPFISALETVQTSLSIVALVLDTLKPNKEVLVSACTSELFATHATYELVSQGVPFRDAYQTIGLHLDTLHAGSAHTVLKQSSHLGGTGNLGLGKLKGTLQKEQQWWQNKITHFQHCMKLLKGGEQA